MVIVVDTNVFVSAIGFGGKPEKVIDLVMAKRISGLASARTLLELRTALKEKLGFNEPELGRITALINKKFSVIQTDEIDIKTSRDPKDSHILAVTHLAKIDYIISGDKDLLSLGTYNEVPIIGPAEFLTRMRSDD